MNTEDFVTYEQAVALKKLGFDQSCTHYYECGELTCQYDTVSNDGGYSYDISVDDLICSVNKNCPNTDVFDAPTLAQVQKWLYKPKDLKLFVIPSDSRKVPYSYVIFNTAKTIYKNPPRYYSSYEEALSAGITECLKLLDND